MNTKIYSALIIASAISTLSSFDLLADSNAVKDTMLRDKTAEFNYETQTGMITLENFVPGEMKIAREAKPIDAILVLDFSSSMTQSYSVDSTYSKVLATNRYCAADLYYKSGSSYSCFSPESTEKKTRDEVAYVKVDKTYNTIKVNYGGQAYDLHVIHTIDPNWAHSQSSTSTTTSRSWAYISVNSKRIFLRQDGSPIEESGSTSVAYNTFPNGVDGYKITPAQLDERTLYTQLAKSSGYHTNTRLAALQFAAGRFVELLAKHASDTKKKDRIAIVTFQGTSIDRVYPYFYNDTDGSKYLTSSSLSYLMECPTDKKKSGKRDGNIEGKAFVAKRFVDMASENAELYLKYAMSDIEPLGSTPVNLGVDIACELMNKSGRTGDDVARYIIVFSDGDPTTTSGESGFTSSSLGEKSIADKSVSAAYTYKHSSTKKTSVFTIYCHSNDPSTNANTFMDHLSSNYPDAEAYNDNTTKLPDAEAKYYKTAKDNLATVFNEIAQEIIVESSSKYDVKTTLNDFIANEYFQLPEGVNQETAYENILVYENKCAGYDTTTKVYSWSDVYTPKGKSDGIILTITPRSKTNNDKVSISGYDFGKNWCGLDISTNPPTPHGARLVVNIPFVYTKTAVWGDLPTNTDSSGVTVVDKETQEVKEDIKYPIPTLPFCYLKLSRAGLHKGESAIYIVSKVDGEFIDKVVINGTGSGLDTVALYGVPGEEFMVTETNWNWAYHKTQTTMTKSLPLDPSTGKPTSYRLTFPFTGDHKTPTGGSEYEKEKDPANLHNHDEAYKVNNFSLPALTPFMYSR